MLDPITISVINNIWMCLSLIYIHTNTYSDEHDNHDNNNNNKT